MTHKKDSDTPTSGQSRIESNQNVCEAASASNDPVLPTSSSFEGSTQSMPDNPDHSKADELISNAN